MSALKQSSVPFPVTHPNITPHCFECDIFGAGTEIPDQLLGLHVFILMVAYGSYCTRGIFFF